MWILSQAGQDEVLSMADGAIGVGVFGMLALLGVNLIHRTRDVDRRRDETVQIAMDLALDREGRANADRDRALLDLSEARGELADLRDEMEALREQWDEERRRFDIERTRREAEEGGSAR